MPRPSRHPRPAPAAPTPPRPGPSRRWWPVVAVVLVGSAALAAVLAWPRTEAGPPDDMVWVPPGTFRMGSAEARSPCASGVCGAADSLPVHEVELDGFFMDRTPVTNAQFARFVRATGQVTVAERTVDGVPPGSFVFRPPPGVTDLSNPYAWWAFQPGASWRHPDGPGSDIEGRDDHPVVQVCWDDAVAYAKWAGKRLPTEAEWEYAARGGLDQKRYAWGDELRPGGRWMANIWQGEFPARDSGEDGFRGTSPVGSFPPNGYGLVDMSGNVWEWCADWYRPDAYKDGPRKNPQGPPDSHDPDEPGVPKRVQRGGSFLCSDAYCKGYLPGARGKGQPNSAANHIGFRCARDRN